MAALFADGGRLAPQAFSRSLNGGETISITLSFGFSQFPILGVYTRE